AFLAALSIEVLCLEDTSLLMSIQPTPGVPQARVACHQHCEGSRDRLGWPRRCGSGREESDRITGLGVIAQGSPLVFFLNGLRVFRSAGASRRGHSKRPPQHTGVVWSEHCGGPRGTAWHTMQVITGVFGSGTRAAHRGLGAACAHSCQM